MKMPQKRKDLKIEGSNLWYLAGLITSDGCLCKDGGHIDDITSKDRNFLESIRSRFGIASRVCIKNKGTNKQAYRIQIANKNFYDFLLSTGLMQNKSLIVGAINVPSQFFKDFLRGLIDGDGSIRSWIHPTNFRQQWSLRIYSGSKKFLEWLEVKIKEHLRSCGRMHSSHEPGTVYVLKYGEMAAREIVKRRYYKNCFGLERKIKLANECVGSYRGWDKSKTIFN
jgi:hypothetical protein